MIRFGRRRWYWFWIPRKLSSRIKMMLFITLVLIVLLWGRIFYVIQSGTVGVLFSPLFGGTQLDTVLHEGLNVVWPWKEVFIYDNRLQARQFSMSTLVESSMRVDIDIVVYFRLIEANVPRVHKEVGTNYAAMMVEPMVRSEVREVMGRVSLEKVRDSDSSELERALVEQLNEAAGKVEERESNGKMHEESLVQFERVVINRLTIPDPVNQAVNWKQEQEQYLLGYQFILQRAELEARKRNVEAEGIASANRVINGSLTPSILTWRNIQAIEELARSNNAKMVIVGGSGKDIPVILGSDVFGPGKGPAAATTDRGSTTEVPGGASAPPQEKAPSTVPDAGRTAAPQPVGHVPAKPRHTDTDSKGHVLPEFRGQPPTAPAPSDNTHEGRPVEPEPPAVIIREHP